MFVPAPLPREFYARSPLVLARELLGKKFVRKQSGVILSGIITETEAYCGTNDTASHASRGMTPRNAVMFGDAGHAYVYFCYGIHFMMNVVAESQGVAGAVLIRGAEPLEGIEKMKQWRGRAHNLADGPGKLCQAFAIGRELNGWDLTLGKKLWIEPLLTVKRSRIHRTPRIGIDYADPKHRDALWRFVLEKPLKF